ncbi:MAG: TIGR02266 family protein [Deltaproteobacteria bacterium]|nr:TIGR02266 family protein [Deltaproteobacteria bacterium]
MSDGNGERRSGDRVAVGLVVRLKHGNIDEFIERFAVNLSPGGMFVQSRSPQPVGTEVRFEVHIAGGLPVLRGSGTVAWVRPEGVEGPSGMGITFTVLDPHSQTLVERMLALRGAREPGTVEPGPGQEAPPPASRSMVDTTTEALAAQLGDLAPAEPQPLEEQEVVLDFDDDEVHDATPPEPRSPVPAPMDPPPAPAQPLSEPDLELDIDVDLSDDEDDALDIDVDEVVDPHAPPPVVFLEAPETIPEIGPVIGIDLGTTNSCVAVFEEGRPRVIQSKQGYNTIPSVIALAKNDRLLVGHPAKGQMLINPIRTVYGAKRLVGRNFESPVVREVASHFHYPICADRIGRAAVQLGDHILSLEEVQGLILREAKQMAQEHLSQEVHRAVVTVPAYYSDAQRQAVRMAGQLCGLKVERMLNEPTAAALAYGLNRELNRTVLIYDLGGGTFDATVMKISDNVFEVLATGGDTFLGGADFDNCVVDYLLGVFENNEGMPFQGDRVALSRVADAAEAAKVALSESRSHEIHVPYLVVDADGVPHDLKTTLDRETLDELHEGLVERTLDVVRDVLLDAGMRPDGIDDVILVGGQSRSPLVREKLALFFGKPPHPGVHPDEAVGLGAALLAASLGKVDSVVLVDVLSMTLGVGLPGGRFHRIIERNTPLPVRKTYSLATTRNDQTRLEISVFQGEDEHIAGNEFLGTARLDGLPKLPAGQVRVAVTFELGPDCVLSVSARNIATGQEIATQLATRGTPEEIRNRLKADVGASREAEQRATDALPSTSGRLLSFFKRMVGKA